jgi:hypothetical protein
MRNECGKRTASGLLLPFVLLIALLLPAPAVAQDDAESRVVPTALGAVAGVAGGGYLALSLIVAEARVGRYVHDIEDVLGWRSAPVLIGAATGAALGFYSPPRLEGAILYGVAGLGAGAVVGWGIGSIWGQTPEARWAGAAIGAGVGLAAGNVVGMLRPPNPDGGGVIPFFIRIPL